MITVGVTGTNGKTSTTLLVGAALGALGRPVAMTTTLGSFLDEKPFAAPATLDGFLATMRAGHQRGGRYAAIEVTSEALARGFAKAWPCRVGVLTNFTRDHLDAHGSPEHYLASKAQLFLSLPPGGVAVLNGCDPASELLAEVIGPDVRVLHYGLPSRGDPVTALDVRAGTVSVGWDGTRLDVDAGAGLGGFSARLSLRHIGAIYAENALAALTASLALGLEPGAAIAALEAAAPPTGRFQVFGQGPRAVLDYAHTPDALRRTLACARALCDGTLWVVFGAGGERDRDKRPEMGAAARAADRVVLTSDNPRREDPAAIAAAIRSGMDPDQRVEIELDRARAIELAIGQARSGDVVVVAGKGHERTQTLPDGERSFVDADVIERALARVRAAEDPGS